MSPSAPRVSRSVDARLITALRLISVVGAVGFTVIWLILDRLEPGLAAPTAAHPAVMTAGFVCLVVSLAAAAVRAGLGRLGRGTVALLAVAATSAAVATVWSQQCSTTQRSCYEILNEQHGMTTTATHNLAAATMFVATIACAVGMTIRMRRVLAPASKFACALCAVGVAVTTIPWIAGVEQGAGGLFERVLATTLLIWLTVLSDQVRRVGDGPDVDLRDRQAAARERLSRGVREGT